MLKVCKYGKKYENVRRRKTFAVTVGLTFDAQFWKFSSFSKLINWGRVLLTYLVESVKCLMLMYK